MNKRKRNDTDNDDDFDPDDLKHTFNFNKNNIYFYCPVSSASIIKLINAISSIEENGYSNIHLYIQSKGGDVYAGISGMNHIKNSNIPIITYVDGLCASAATFISIAGSKRFMYKCSEVLIHHIQTATWGRYEDMKSDMDNNTKLMNILRFM